jgi:hypothetical protein
LLRVQHFQQSSGWIAPDTNPEFVNFVEQHHRIVGASAFQTLKTTEKKAAFSALELTHQLTRHEYRHDAARKRSNVGAAVAPNFRFIRHTCGTHSAF